MSREHALSFADQASTRAVMTLCLGRIADSFGATERADALFTQAARLFEKAAHLARLA